MEEGVLPPLPSISCSRCARQLGTVPRFWTVPYWPEDQEEANATSKERGIDKKPYNPGSGRRSGQPAWLMWAHCKGQQQRSDHNPHVNCSGGCGPKCCAEISTHSGSTANTVWGNWILLHQQLSRHCPVPAPYKTLRDLGSLSSPYSFPCPTKICSSSILRDRICFIYSHIAFLPSPPPDKHPLSLIFTGYASQIFREQKSMGKYAWALLAQGETRQCRAVLCSEDGESSCLG